MLARKRYYSEWNIIVCKLDGLYAPNPEECTIELHIDLVHTVEFAYFL